MLTLLYTRLSIRCTEGHYGGVQLTGTLYIRLLRYLGTMYYEVHTHTRADHAASSTTTVQKFIDFRGPSLYEYLLTFSMPS